MRTREDITRGSIRCNRCGVSMLNGACPKCGREQCHINLYFQGTVYKFYRDTKDTLLSQASAMKMLENINRELSDKNTPFRIDNWLSYQQRKVEKAVDSWISDCKAEVTKGRMRASVPDGYRSIAKTHILNDSYGLGKFQINEIGAIEVNQFHESLPDNLKKSTRRTIMNTLRAFLNWSHKKGFISHVPALPRVHTCGTNSHIYFIESSGKIKIGYTKDIYRRLETLQTSCPAKVNLLFLIDGGGDMESMLHNKFKAHYSHGEWFHAHNEILDYIESNKHLCLKESLDLT